MNDRSPEAFAEKVRKHITDHDHEMLFRAGCCSHFALRAFRRGVGEPVYTESHGAGSVGHAFVITKDGLGFDRKGFRAVTAIVAEFGEKAYYRADEAKIQAAADKNVLPDDLKQRVNDIADGMISAYLACKPTDSQS
jgi:hypothetical protein